MHDIGRSDAFVAFGSIIATICDDGRDLVVVIVLSLIGPTCYQN